MIGIIIASVLFIQQGMSCLDSLCLPEFYVSRHRARVTEKTEYRKPPISAVPPLRLRIEDLRPQLEVREEREPVFRTVYFDFDSAKLRESEKAKLSDLKGRRGRLSITGYTCDIGTREYNDRLAVRRAQAVRDYLEVDAEVSGKGKCCYVSADRKKNRRVEISGYVIRTDPSSSEKTPE